MLKNKFSYYFWRVAIGVSIGFILMFLKSNVFAATVSTTDTFSLNYYSCLGSTSANCSTETSSYLSKNTKYVLEEFGSTIGHYEMRFMDSRFYNANGFKTGYTYTINFKWAFDPRDSYMSKANNYVNDVLGWSGSAYQESIIKNSSCSMQVSSSNAYQVYFTCIVEVSSNTNYLLVRTTLKENRHLISPGIYYMYQANITSVEGEELTAIKEQTQTIINQTNQMITAIGGSTKVQEDIYNEISDDSDPSIDVSGMSGVQGLLPAGPLDSLLVLPVNLLNILVNATSGTCEPFTFTFVFDSEWELPCFDTFWNQVPTTLLLFMSDLPAVYIFVKWAKSIYKRVERAVSFESSVDDEWGGV